MNPECINCGLLRSTCEMDDWKDNCCWKFGKKHEFLDTKVEVFKWETDGTLKEVSDSERKELEGKTHHAKDDCPKCPICGGHEHEIDLRVKANSCESKVEEDWEIEFGKQFAIAEFVNVFQKGNVTRIFRDEVYPDEIKSFIKELLVNSNRKTLQENKEIFWKGYESGWDCCHNRLE